MKKLEAVIQPNRLDAVRSALYEVGIQGMTVMEVRGHGRQKGHTELYRGHEYSVDLLPKIKLETVVPDKLVDDAIKAIVDAAHTGKIGDGKIFLSDIAEAVRIRDSNRGEEAI
jgi:nitrogen regulatory protein P-II 1